ncbi:hypothetical protein CBL_05305 [Carabus blaptoides fortunei]
MFSTLDRDAPRPDATLSPSPPRRGAHKRVVIPRTCVQAFSIAHASRYLTLSHSGLVMSHAGVFVLQIEVSIKNDRSRRQNGPRACANAHAEPRELNIAQRARIGERALAELNEDRR